MIYIVYPVFVRDNHNKELLRKAYASVQSKHETQIVSVVNACKFPEVLQGHVIQRKENIVSGAWNDGLNFAFSDGGDEDLVLFVNQDVKFNPDTLDRLYDHSGHHDFVSGNLAKINRYSLFGGRLKSFKDFMERDVFFKQSGMVFDEAFKPAYFEDNDFSHRLYLLGLKTVPCKVANASHEGSSVIRHDGAMKAENNRTFKVNASYYERKWGGKPHQEKFKTPFGK